VNAIQPRTHAFGGFLAVGRSGAAAPIGSGLISALPYPVRIRTDNTAKFIQLNTEGDIAELGAGASRQPDNGALRTWELPGASHIDSHEAAYEVATIARDQPNVPVPRCVLGTPITGTGTPLDGINETNNMPLYELEHSALVALQKWLTNGTQPPHSPQVSTFPVFFGAFDIVNHDSLGNALGGIRLPEIVAPTETYSAINFATTDPRNMSPDQVYKLIQDTFTALQTGGITNETLRAEGLCLLSGYYLKLPKSTLSRLYSSHADYVAKYTAAAKAAQAASFLTPADAADGIARAQAAPIP
jgi:alpha/beta hydrolase family protein